MNNFFNASILFQKSELWVKKKKTRQNERILSGMQPIDF